MNPVSHSARYVLAGAASAIVIVFNPNHCWAAVGPALPWDYTLNVIQNFVVGPLAQFVVCVSTICAVLGFALAGDSELVRRFAKALIGTGVALLAVQLLNYLAP